MTRKLTLISLLIVLALPALSWGQTDSYRGRISIIPSTGEPNHIANKAYQNLDHAVDVRDYMDGQSGRPTYATWTADQAATDVYTVVAAAVAASDAAGGGTVRLPKGHYYLNTAATITAAKVIKLTGDPNGTHIFIGTTVGNRPAITLAGNNSVVEDLTITGEHSGFANDELVSTELRRSLKITGDNVTVARCRFLGGVVAVNFEAVAGGAVRACWFRNDDIDRDAIGTYPNQNNCQAIYATGDCNDIEIASNHCYGYGEFVVSGNRCAGWRVRDNVCELQGDNGIYLNLLNSTITGNTVRDAYQAGIKGYFSGVALTGNAIYTSAAYTSADGIYAHALITATGHPADAQNNTSYNIAIANNTVQGVFTGSLVEVAENPSDYSGFHNTSIVGNTLRGGLTTVGATSGLVGIVLYTPNGDPCSYGCVVANNHVSQCFRGVTVAAVGTGFHQNLQITNNTFQSIIGNTMNLSRVTQANISGNISLDPIGTGVTPYAFYLTTVTNSRFAGNRVGNLGAGTMGYGFYEVSGCATNDYLLNRVHLTDYSTHYTLNDATGSIVVPNVTRTRSLTGDSAFAPGEGRTFFINPNGASRNYNPFGQFPTGYEVILINTASAAETLTFDSAGVNAAVAQNNRGIFIYDGAAWRKVYVGS